MQALQVEAALPARQRCSHSASAVEDFANGQQLGAAHAASTTTAKCASATGTDAWATATAIRATDIQQQQQLLRHRSSGSSETFPSGAGLLSPGSTGVVQPRRTTLTGTLAAGALQQRLSSFSRVGAAGHGEGSNNGAAKRPPPPASSPPPPPGGTATVEATLVRVCTPWGT